MVTKTKKKADTKGANSATAANPNRVNTAYADYLRSYSYPESVIEAVHVRLEDQSQTNGLKSQILQLQSELADLRMRHSFAALNSTSSRSRPAAGPKADPKPPAPVPAPEKPEPMPKPSPKEHPKPTEPAKPAKPVKVQTSDSPNGTRSKWEGLPATGLIRWCAHNGYDREATAGIMTKLGFEVADGTLRIQHRAGTQGEAGGRGPIPFLTKKQAATIADIAGTAPEKARNTKPAGKRGRPLKAKGR